MVNLFLSKTEVFLLIVSCMILFIVLWIYFMSPSTERFKRLTSPVDDMLKNGKTLDLVFFSGNTPGERFCKWLMDSPFSHVGLLVRLDGELYIWDSDLGQRLKDGPRFGKLNDKLERYKGSKVIGWLPYEGPSVKEEDVMNIIMKHINSGFNYGMISWALCRLFPTYKHPKDMLFCGELVTITLQELGLVDKNLNHSLFDPGHYFNKQVPLLSGSYGNMRYFKMGI